MATAVTLQAYWMGRNFTHAKELNASIIRNAEELLVRVNAVYADYTKATNTNKPATVNSGWRPLSVNNATPNASKTSLHLSGRAIDIADGNKTFGNWLLTAAGLKSLETNKLWIEDPKATPTWVHLQPLPPGSGRRVFNP